MDQHHSAAKHFISFIIVALIAVVFLIFWTNQDSIFASGSQQQFVVLSIVAAGFLVGLLYLVNKPHEAKAHKSSKKKKK
jgi:tetrahydromethanopterin S-methyltransferase subunit E